MVGENAPESCSLWRASGCRRRETGQRRVTWLSSCSLSTSAVRVRTLGLAAMPRGDAGPTSAMRCLVVTLITFGMDHSSGTLCITVEDSSSINSRPSVQLHCSRRICARWTEVEVAVVDAQKGWSALPETSFCCVYNSKQSVQKRKTHRQGWVRLLTIRLPRLFAPC